MFDYVTDQLSYEFDLTKKECLEGTKILSSEWLKIVNIRLGNANRHQAQVHQTTIQRCRVAWLPIWSLLLQYQSGPRLPPTSGLVA